MSEETKDPEKDAETGKSGVLGKAKKTVEVVEKVGATAEVASNAFGMVKWVAIAVVTLSLLGTGYAAYKTITKPVAAVTEAAGTVVEKVGDGAGAIKDGASGVINRLVIPSANQARLNKLAEAAFPVLFKMDKTKGDSMREGMFRRTNFGGSDGKVCKFEKDFGAGTLAAFAAVDVKAHETAASLGSQDDRLIRMVIRAEDDDISFNTHWDDEAQQWVMKWKRTTVSKPINDKTAEARLMDILAAIPGNCR